MRRRPETCAISTPEAGSALALRSARLASCSLRPGDSADVGAMPRSRRHPISKPKRHIASPTKRDDVSAEQLSKSNHVHTAFLPDFALPGVGEMEKPTTIRANQRAGFAD